MMKKYLPKLISGERGQTLPIVLALLAIGGLTIAASLNYISSGLNSGRMINENIKGLYAAEAGIEDAVWSISSGVPPSEQLTEDINGMDVSIETVDHGTYTVYMGEMIPIGVHNPYLDVDGEIIPDGGSYKYIITITWRPDSGEPVIHIEGVGARLPLGYSYQDGSANLFAGNLSTGEPDEIEDQNGAWMINWELSPPYPSISENNTTETQTFYMDGSGPLEGDYTWVVARRSDIGAVGEINGTLYTITSTAARAEDGRITAKIIADVISGNTTTDIISWQILN
jgi:hypothetical protein